MKLTTRDFLLHKIDHSLPALAPIPALLAAGDPDGAEAAFAGYLRTSLSPEKYFRIPYYPPENAWLMKDESEYDAAERMARGMFMSVGFMHDFGEGGVQFEANPTPNQYKEWTWQLNRHHEWRMLGHLYRETGDEKYARLFADLFTAWRAQCECPDDAPGGATKAFRTIEIGIRLTKIWHYAIHAFLHSPSLTDHLLCDIFASMWENANRVRLHPTKANWLIMEMAGLFHVGTLYPFFTDAAEWREYAAARLTAELDVQIYPDSFQYELTTGYHGVVIMNYGYAADICRAMEQPLPPAFHEVMRRAYGMYPKLSKPDLKTPALNDGGCADVAAQCAQGLALFPEKEELRYFASARAEGEPMLPKDTVMPYSGMAVLRDDWSADAQWAFFESAPFGRGHQHEDKLQFLLYAYGRDLLRDTGNYAYDTSEMRKFVLSTRSHNTVMVDGMEQNRRGRYEWHEEDIRKLSDLTAELGEARDVLEGIYDEGYGPEYLPVTHRRRVIKVKDHPLGLGTFYVIVDRMEPAEGEHLYEAIFQLEDVPLKLDGLCGWSRAEADYGGGVTLTLISSGSAAVRRGCEAPFMGWRTPDVPAPAVLFGRRGGAEMLVTVVYPSESGCPITGISLDGGKLVIEAAGGTAVVAL